LLVLYLVFVLNWWQVDRLCSFWPYVGAYFWNSQKNTRSRSCFLL